MLGASLSVFYVSTENMHVSRILLSGALVVELFLLFIGVRVNNISKRAFTGMLILISLFEYLLWNIYAATNPVSDYKVLLEGAKSIVNGTFKSLSFDKTNYFYFYNFQIGYTTYLALVMKVFGEGLVWFKILDGLYMTLTSIIIYKLVNKISNDKSAAISSLLYAVFIPNVFGASIINNQHLSTLLLICAIYFILDHRLSFASYAGIILGFTQIIRPVAIIAIIASFLYYFISALENGSYTSWLKRFALLIIAFMLVIRGFDFALIKAGVSPGPISKDNVKYFKFVLGLTGNGVYSIPTENAEKTQVYYDLKTLNFDYDRYNEECLKAIGKSLKDYKKTLRFIVIKMHNFMGGKDNQYEFALENAKITEFINYLLELGHLQYITMIVFSLAAIILKLIDRRIKVDIISILIIGFMLVHVFIETQTRYRYETYVFLSILSSQFLERFISYKKYTWSKFN